ncbi:MAG: DUF2807 domain-containing protein [Alistipes sp.]|nr:DUF2807 domain-containing protein [Alistipes sp.]
MKKLALLTLIVFTLSSCLTVKMATGEVVEQTMTIDGDIDALALSSGFDVIVDRSIPHGEVRIATHSDMFDKLDIYVKGTTLNISLNSHELQAKTLEVRIPEYAYNTLAISGGADFYWHGCTAPSFTLAASGGADVEMEGSFEELCIAASGGADLEISGITTTLRASASGGADLSLDELLAENVEVSASGGADVEVCALSSITVNASGGADVCYGGDPATKDIECSGGASVQHAR